MRIRNLIWTITGDYSLQVKPDLSSYQKSPNITVYDGIKQGGLARYFDQDAIAMYLLKKIYRHADQTALLDSAQLCIEEAIGQRLDAERAGIRTLRRKALDDALERDFGKMTAYPLGRLKAALFREKLDGSPCIQPQIAVWMERLHELQHAEETMEIIRAIDEVYNGVVDPAFVRKYGTLEEVLAVTPEELLEFSWKDFLDEEAAESSMEYVLEKMTEAMSQLDQMPEEQKQTEEEKEPPDSGNEKKKLVLVDEKALEQAYSYVERNFGRTYLTPLEEKRINHMMCRGIHADCSIYITDGILKNPVLRNYQYALAEKQRTKTIDFYKQNYTIVRHQIRSLADMLRKALVVQEEEEYIRSDYGQIVPSALWNVGRTENAQLFTRKLQNDARSFAVDLLIDASGSQRKRQMPVALQAYIIAEAMSELQIPCRVMSFCTFWNYTVLQRFREYEDGRQANQNIFDFTTNSNNRDGLAIRTIGRTLLQREEDSKVLIVLSDGKPNDVMINRPNVRHPEPYLGRRAVLDAGGEVRYLRQNNVAVLGVFVGEESELDAERRIFGKDFAYIRSIEHFSDRVGRYLMKQIEDR
ncbi:MAG: nitric oxide reductase activation protein [Eubacteriales bacterium]|nr:nitric oxide reductase activation protein [Eubacteriales bacterium]